MTTKLTDDEKRVKIATACGWRDCKIADGKPVGIYPINNTHWDLPDYFVSLDAIHEAEENLFRRGWSYQTKYYDELKKLCGYEACIAIHATATQRCEAFARTLNLW